MSNPKRFDPDVSRRGDAYMDSKPDGDYVRHEDYAALEAENARLTAQLAAIQGGMGEVAEVVGYLDAHDCLWNETTHPDRMIPLMTVAQHQRIVAALLSGG